MFNIEAARKAGYSDSEIVDHLSSKVKFNAGAARQAGYSDAEIIGQLVKTAPQAKPATEPAAVKPAVVAKPAPVTPAVNPSAELAKPPAMNELSRLAHKNDNANLPQSPIDSIANAGARVAYGLAQGAVTPLAGAAQVLNTTESLPVAIGKRYMNAAASVANKLGLVSPETVQRTKELFPMQNLPDGPIQKGLNTAVQAFDWMRTGRDVLNPEATGGSPISVTEQEAKAHPVMTRVSGALENFVPVVPQIVASQGNPLALGAVSGLSHFNEATARYKGINPNASNAEAETAATPGSAVNAVAFGGMGKVGAVGRDLLARAVPVTAEGIVSSGAKKFIGNTAATMATDMPYMTAQGMAVGETEKAMGVSPDYKISDSLKWDTLLETGLVTAFFGAHQSLAVRKQAKVLGDTIRDTNQSPSNRLAAVKIVAETMAKRGAKDEAKAFAEQATQKILMGENKDILNDKDQDILNARKQAQADLTSALNEAFSTVDEKAHASATSPLNDRSQPTEAQKEAGNYKHGDEIKLGGRGGLPVLVENPQGSVREGVDPNGKEWANYMMDHYGRIRGTAGRDSVDGKKQGVDVFIKPGTDENAPGESVFVIDQINPETGKLDEHKTMIGYSSKEEAQAAYLRNYDETGPNRIGAITETTLPDFKEWLNAGDMKKAFAKELFDNKGELLPEKGGEANGETKGATNADETQSPAEGQEGLLKFDVTGIDRNGDEVTYQIDAKDAQEAMDRAESANPGMTADSATERATTPVTEAPASEPEIPVSADGGAKIPDHIVAEVENPQERSPEFSQETKRQTKETLHEKMQSGEISSDSPIRMTTTQELNHILENGELRIGEDAEGRQGISAQVMGKTPVIVGYGGNGISAAIIFDKSHVATKDGKPIKGQAPNEVKINPSANVRDLRFVIDGHKDILTFDQLREAIKKQGEAELDAQQREAAPQETQVGKEAGDFQTILDALNQQTASRKGKGKKSFYTDSDFQNYLKENYPSVAGMEKKHVLASLKAAVSGKELTDGQQQVIDNFRHDLEGLRQRAEANKPDLETRAAEVALEQGVDISEFTTEEKQKLVDNYDKWLAERQKSSPIFEKTTAGDQGKLFATPPTFGKKPQGKGVAEENPMEAEMRARKAEQAQTGFGFDTGGYANRQGPTRPTAQPFLEQPELVELGKAINEGKVPQLVKSIARGVLGRFMGNQRTGEALIKLRRDLFIGPMLEEYTFRGKDQADVDAKFMQFQTIVKNNHGNANLEFRKDFDRKTRKTTFRAYDKDPDYVMKTLAHEIGHNVDFIPDSMIRGRGNIFGHIAAVKGYMKKTLAMYEGAKGQPLTEADRVRLQKEARLNTPKGEDIITTITREVPRYEEAGITPEMVRAIWQDVNARDKYPELYLFLAKMSDAEKKSIVVQAMKGIVDQRLSSLGNRRQVGVDTITEQVVTPAKQRPEAVKAEFERLLKEEIQKRRLYEYDKVMGELKALTQTWKPFDDKASPEYTKYRYSPAELYADAVSVLVNEPQLLKDTAPSFYKAFLYYAKERPEFRDAYSALSRLSRNPEELQSERYRKEMEMYQKGAEEANRIRQEKPDSESMFDTIMRAAVDKNWDVLKELPKDAAGENVKNTINEIQYLGGEIGNYVKKVVETRSGLESSGMTVNDLSAYMLAKHIIKNRDTMANTQGKTAATEKAKLDWMRKEFGREKFAALEKAAKEFKEHRKYVIKRIEESGIVTSELLQKIKENEDYAHIDVQKYMDEKFGTGTAAGAGWKKHAEGTLEDVNNVFVATVLQDMSILRMAKINEAKTAITDVFSSIGKTVPAEMKWDSNIGGKKAVEPADNTKALLTVLKDGKPVSYVVDKHVADVFKYDPIKATKVSEVFGYVTQFFRDILVSKNPAWMTRNVYRDFKGTVKNNPEIAWWNPADRLRLIREYKNAFKEVYRDVMKGERSDDIETMYQQHMLNSDRMFSSKETTFDDELTRIAREFHFGEKEYNNFIARKAKAFYNYLDKWGKISEQSSKVAGYKLMKGKGLQGKELSARVRQRIGTPDYRRQGSLQKLSNNIFIFSNVNKEGIRSAVEAYKQDPISYVFKTIESNIFPKVLLGVAAAGFFGDDIKKIVEKIPSWDRRSYNVVPIPNVMIRELKERGLIGEHAAAYFRLPQDYEGQFWGSVAYDLTQGDFQGVASDIKGGQPYRLHPVLNTAMDWFTYMSGGNPVDSFRQKEILTREQQKYHTVEGNLSGKAIAGMAKNTWNQMGLGNLYKADNKEFPRDMTITERTLKSFPLNALGTYITVTDNGYQEQLSKKIFAERDKKAIASYEVGDKINDAVREGKITPKWRQVIYRKLVEDKMIDPRSYTPGRFNSQMNRSIQQKKFGIKPASKKEAKQLEEITQEY